MATQLRGRAGFGPDPGCLIFVIIVGIIAAILIPYTGRHRENAYLASTEERITSLAGALETYFEENGSYPKATSVQQLAEELRLDLPETGDLRYECWSDSDEDPDCTEYALGGAGLDGLWRRASLRDYEPADSLSSRGADIVYRDGRFIQKPEAWDLSWRTGSGLLPLIALVGGGVLLLWFLKELFWG